MGLWSSSHQRLRDRRAEHLSLGGWRVHGYTLVLEELLHRGELCSQETTELHSRLLQVAAGVGKLEIVRKLLRRGAIPPKVFQDLIETVGGPYFKVLGGTLIKRLLLARILGSRFSQEAIDRLELSARTRNLLEKRGITKMGQIFEPSDEQLRRIRNFGEGPLVELKLQLERLMSANDEMPPADN